MILVHHASGAERIEGWPEGVFYGFPTTAAYRCPRCGALTNFPGPRTDADSYVPEAVRVLFDIETKANRRYRPGVTVDFLCCGCHLAVRIGFDRYIGKYREMWSVVDVLETTIEGTQ